jgi:hypothetical membrane protein
MRRLALGGIVGPALFAVVVVVCGALRPGYEHASQLISELGATGTPHAGLMNLAGFVASGALIAAFGLSLGAVLPRGRASRAIAVLLGLFGVGLVLAGAFPCAPGCPQDAPTLHDGVSVAAFVSAIAGIALAARRFRTIAAWRPLWAYSAVSSGLALCLLGALAATVDGGPLRGLWQRLLVGTLFLWCIVAGVRAVRPADGRSAPTRSGVAADGPRGL